MNKPAKKDVDWESEKPDGRDRPTFKIHTLRESQAMKLEQLMENIEKPIYIPVGDQDTEYQAPDAIRNVAGATSQSGTGELSVFRSIRRRDMARVRAEEMAKIEVYLVYEEGERLDYEDAVTSKRQAHTDKTAKNRIKRQRKTEAKQRAVAQSKLFTANDKQAVVVKRIPKTADSTSSRLKASKRIEGDEEATKLCAAQI